MSQNKQRNNPIKSFFEKLWYKLRYTTPKLVPIGKNVENSPILIEGTKVKSLPANEKNVQPHGGSKYVLIPADYEGLRDKNPVSSSYILEPRETGLAHLLIYEFTEPQK